MSCLLFVVFASHIKRQVCCLSHSFSIPHRFVSDRFLFCYFSRQQQQPLFFYNSISNNIWLSSQSQSLLLPLPLPLLASLLLFKNSCQSRCLITFNSILFSFLIIAQ